MVRDLEAKGTLMEALFEAQETTISEMETLTRQLETEQKLTPQQAHDDLRSHAARERQRAKWHAERLNKNVPPKKATR